MARAARQRESLHMEAVYRFHPLFADHSFPVWYGCEGGTRHQLPWKEEMSSSSATGWWSLAWVNAHSLRRSSSWQAVSLLPWQPVRDRHRVAEGAPCDHLDTMLTMVDHDVFLANPGVESNCRSWTLCHACAGSRGNVQPMSTCSPPLLTPWALMTSGDYHWGRCDRGGT